jgi:signal transduction histidine kinase/CheY-like chemotaxis protein
MDIRTLYLVSSLLAVFLTVGTLCLAWGRPANRYVRAWALSNTLVAFGQLAIAFRGTYVPEWLSVALTCPLLFLSAYAGLSGFQALLGNRRLGRTGLGMTIAALAGFWTLCLTDASIASRTIFFSAAEAVLLGLIAFYALQPTRPELRWPLRVTATAFGVDAVLLALRAVATAMWPVMPEIQRSHAGEAAFLSLFGMTYVALNYAYVWLIIADSAARHLDEQGRLLAALEQQAADLRTAKTAAEAASATKSIFLATMSHEIRTPLNGVIGFAELLLQSPLSEEQRRYVLLQRDAGIGLLAVINDVLDFSKLDAGQFVIEPADVDFPALMRSCAALFVPAAQDKRLTLTVEIEPSVPSRGRLDGHRLRQAVTNLVSNAVKFTRIGSVTLHVEGPASDAVPLLRIAVRDTGIGIPADKLGKLFQDFSQIDGSISREFGGTGLGLAISRRIIDLMGGSLGVESDFGVGSTFWIKVPFEPASLPPIEAETAGASAGGAAKQTGLHILVAEDVLPNQIMIEILLHKGGHEVTIVENGVAAVEAVANGDFDLILMDLQMPVMDGIEATREIRKLPGKPSRIPIVALTANVMPDEIEACRAAGMQAHLAKPIDPNKLMALIERLGAEATVF